MSRADRGRGPRPVHRGPIARALFGRGRAEVRHRLVAALVVGLGASLGVGLMARVDVVAPVLRVVDAEAPSLRLDHLAAVTAPEIPAPRFESVNAEIARLDARRVGLAATAVRSELGRGAFPGAALLIGRGTQVVEKRGFGRTAPGGASVDPSATLYDLASLTKVIATTSAIMLLFEDGRIDLDAPVSRYLPEFSGGAKDRVTVRHLLTHTSGLPAAVGTGAGERADVLRRLVATPLRGAPGQKVEYSDIGPIVLWAAADRITEEPLAELLDRRIFQPLGMGNTSFSPSLCDACAPTSTRIQGRVHDPIAHRLGGVSGNAGLFATAEDVGRFAAMLAGGGEIEGVRVFQEETVRTFTSRQRGAGSRALGWDTREIRGATPGRSASLGFGHTGFTGTSLWIDPERETWSVLLTNRTYNRGPNRMQALRRTINERVAEAADLAE